ncbi:hypothetical protein RHGRI_023450 [Rhododendron griersonianum]|uniref:Uncharacterized protein n=1 Tax=Rhododendron griersonianum TaxID=479676 RepID=A0AAV6J4U3_9ERIC|nr:hypothetical protein RHGRI_023450 [Rhododendron griersonianum]
MRKNSAHTHNQGRPEAAEIRDPFKKTRVWLRHLRLRPRLQGQDQLFPFAPPTPPYPRYYYQLERSPVPSSKKKTLALTVVGKPQSVDWYRTKVIARMESSHGGKPAYASGSTVESSSGPRPSVPARSTRAAQQQHRFKPLLRREGCWSNCDSSSLTSTIVVRTISCRGSTAQAHVDDIKKIHLRELMSDTKRCNSMTVEFDGILLDYLPQCATMDKLFKLTEAAGLKGKISRMVNGDRINSTKNRCVLHVALRAPKDAVINGDGKMWSQMFGKFWTRSRNSLRGCSVVPGPPNVDPIDVARNISGFNLETTLVVVVSKTFTIAETMLNARRGNGFHLLRAYHILLQALSFEHASGSNNGAGPCARAYVSEGYASSVPSRFVLILSSLFICYLYR